MKKVLAAFIMVLIFSLLIVGCEDVVTGSGELKTEEYDFNDFDSVEISHAFNFEIQRGDSYRVSITADDNILEYIRVSQTGRTLKIGLDWLVRFGDATLEADITMPEVRGLDISGASSGRMAEFSSAESLNIDISGASSLELIGISAGDIDFDVSGASRATGDITAGDAGFDVSGASTVELEGSAQDMGIDASGASHVKLADFVVNNAEVDLSGASSGIVNLSGELSADVSGASKLEYIGEPSLGSMDISGASTIKKK